MDRKIRILLAKAGCDIHERGALTMLNAFRDAGMEVIYTGRYQTPKAIANAAITEDVDIIAVSDQTGSLPIIFKNIIAELKLLDAQNIHFISGGLLGENDVSELEAMGVLGNFGPGSEPQQAVNHIKKLLGE